MTTSVTSSQQNNSAAAALELAKMQAERAKLNTQLTPPASDNSTNSNKRDYHFSGATHIEQQVLVAEENRARTSVQEQTKQHGGGQEGNQDNGGNVKNGNSSAPQGKISHTDNASSNNTSVSTQKQYEVLYGGGNKNFSTSDIRNSMQNIWAKHPGQPGVAAKEALGLAVTNKWNVQQIADTGLFSKSTIDAYLATQGITQKKADSATQTGSGTGSGNWLNTLAHNAEASEIKGYLSTSVEKFTGDALDRAISRLYISSSKKSDSYLNKTINSILSSDAKDDIKLAAVLKFAIEEQINPQQFAELGRPGITKDAINKYLASRGISPNAKDMERIEHNNFTNSIDRSLHWSEGNRDSFGQTHGVIYSDLNSPDSREQLLYGLFNNKAKELTPSQSKEIRQTIEGLFTKGQADGSGMARTLAFSNHMGLNLDQLVSLGLPELTQAAVTGFLKSKGVGVRLGHDGLPLENDGLPTEARPLLEATYKAALSVKVAYTELKKIEHDFYASLASMGDAIVGVGIPKPQALIDAENKLKQANHSFDQVAKACRNVFGIVTGAPADAGHFLEYYDVAPVSGLR